MIKHLVGGYMWLNNDVLGSGIYSLCFEVEFDIRGITHLHSQQIGVIKLFLKLRVQ